MGTVEVGAALRQGLAAMGLDLPTAATEQLLTHLRLLDRWRQTINLTAIDSGEDSVRLHTLDSLAVSPFVRGPRILDIGTGAGFPGLPIASVYPDWEVTLLDSRAKRMMFLAMVKSEAKLGNINLVTSRIEEYRSSVKFDTLIARAVSSLNGLLEGSHHLHHEGLRLVAMKGRYPTEELAQLDGWPIRDSRVERVDVPGLDAERHVVILDF